MPLLIATVTTKVSRITNINMPFAIPLSQPTTPYNVRSYLVLEVSVTKPKGGQEQGEEQEEEQGDTEEKS